MVLFIKRIKIEKKFTLYVLLSPCAWLYANRDGSYHPYSKITLNKQTKLEDVRIYQQHELYIEE